MRFARRLALIALSATALSLSATTTAQEPAGHLLQMFEFHVQSGHNDQFKAGVTAWKECYLAQKGTRSWNTWQRQQGQGNVYAVVFTLPNWAALGAMSEAEGQPRGYWYDVQGREADGADYFSVVPFENFAALDESRASVWEVVAKVRGEAESERLRADFRTALDSSWSHLWRRFPDLSHNP